MPDTSTDTPKANTDTRPVARKNKGGRTTNAKRQGSAKHRNSSSNGNPPAKSSDSTKSGQVLRLLRRNSGASVADVMKITGWQAHTVRGFLSGTVKKKLGLTVTSQIDGKGGRRYQIDKDQTA